MGSRTAPPTDAARPPVPRGAEAVDVSRRPAPARSAPARPPACAPAPGPPAGSGTPASAPPDRPDGSPRPGCACQTARVGWRPAPAGPGSVAAPGGARRLLCPARQSVHEELPIARTGMNHLRRAGASEQADPPARFRRERTATGYRAGRTSGGPTSCSCSRISSAGTPSPGSSGSQSAHRMWTTWPEMASCSAMLTAPRRSACRRAGRSSPACSPTPTACTPTVSTAPRTRCNCAPSISPWASASSRSATSAATRANGTWAQAAAGRASPISRTATSETALMNLRRAKWYAWPNAPAWRWTTSWGASSRILRLMTAKPRSGGRCCHSRTIRRRTGPRASRRSHPPC